MSILLNGSALTPKSVGDVPIKSVYRGTDLIWKAQKTHGGLPVLFDYGTYARANGKFDDFDSISTRFISGWYDTGDTTKKQYIFSERFATAVTIVKFFNDKNAVSVDWWSMTDERRTISSAGRYITLDPRYDSAKYIWIYCVTTGKFVFRGDSADPVID